MDCGAIASNEFPLLALRKRTRSGGGFLPSSMARANCLLGGLTPVERARLQSHLELVPMLRGQVLHTSGDATRFAYFPTTSIVSMVYAMENGACSEIAVIGNEGVLGAPLFPGGGSSPNQAVVLRTGHGYRIGAPSLRDEFNRAGPLMQLLLRFLQALMTQVAQTAVCNRHHVLDQQLCRFLLSILDRQGSDLIVLTHGLMAEMLGTRRESVTESAGKLQRDGLIRCNRGHIEVLDRRGLEQNACECYGVVKREYDRLFMQPIAWPMVASGTH